VFENLLIGGVFLVFIGIGVGCVVWPHRMRWVTRNVLTLFVPAHLHDTYTRVSGVIMVAFWLLVLVFLLKNSL